MKRFLSTTAVVLALSGTAVYAQSGNSNFGSVTAQPTDSFASDLIGMRIYNSQTEVENDAIIEQNARDEWEDVGEINDMIITQDGEVAAVILGVGGFLGIGERDVSVSMEELRMVRDENDETFLVVTTTREELEAAPAFERNMGSDMGQAAESTEAATGEMAADTEATTEELAEDTDAAADTAAPQTATDRPLLTRPTVEREGYQQAEMGDVEQLTAETLQGSSVYGVNDETVGDIEDLVLGEDGRIQMVVISVGGFLGLGAKSVAVTFDELQILRNTQGDDYRFYIDSSEEALEAQPEYEN